MSPERSHEIDPDDLKDLLASGKEKDLTLLDVRQPEEYRQEHIPGAVHIPLPLLESRMDEVPDQGTVVTYCHSGRRSQAAAVILAGSPHPPKSLFSLRGGIAAWGGKILEQPPRVVTFAGITDRAAILERAMDLEKGAWRFYTHLPKLAPDSPLIPVTAELAGMEQRHARTIHEHLRRTKDSVAPFEDVFDALPGTLVEGGQKLEELLRSLTDKGSRSCLELVELALDLEYQAYDLYRGLSRHGDKPEDKEVFSRLAAQERGHVLVLSKVLDRCPVSPTPGG